MVVIILQKEKDSLVPAAGPPCPVRPSGMTWHHDHGFAGVMTLFHTDPPEAQFRARARARVRV